jgi:multidrug transporter EmrE-like cation transporter
MSSFLNSALGKWIAILIVVLTGTFAQTMMKLSTGRLGAFEGGSLFQYLVRLILSPLVWLAIASYGVGVLLYMVLLSFTDLSWMYPVLTAAGLIFATIVSAAFLREHVSLMRLAGIVVVIVGVFLISQT